MKTIILIAISLFFNFFLAKNLISSQKSSSFVDKIKLTVSSARVERGNSSHVDVLRMIKATKTPELRPVNININTIDMPETLTL